MIISIASGKGGTGKTTLAVNLAASLKNRAGKGLTLIDCDVEAPNAHLFLNPDFQTPEKVNAPIPEIDTSGCTFCKKCMDICRYGAIAVMGKTVVTFPELCHSCGGCSVICPEKVITETERVIGWVETGEVKQLPHIRFIQGRLEIGQVMAPPVIRQARACIDPDAVTIIDAPPGTSCPVIAATKGADFVLLVTEPTPFGLHDLTLAVEAVRLMGIPHGIVINRAGLGDDRVREYADREGIEILMEIPFDRAIAQAYSKGELLVNAIPTYGEKFRTLFETIQKRACTKETRSA